MIPGYTGPELVPGTLRGYRRWLVSVRGDLIPVATGNTPWRQGVNTARCRRRDVVTLLGEIVAVSETHPAPLDSCSCGFYAAHHLDLLPNSVDIVVGTIKAHGRIIIGEKGFRAEKAEIESLFLDSAALSQSAIWNINHHYPDVPMFGRLGDLLEEFPPIPVDHLLPEPKPKPEPEQWLRDYWAQGATHGPAMGPSHNVYAQAYLGPWGNGFTLDLSVAAGQMTPEQFEKIKEVFGI